ncbi:helix-turn-helix transcriptional regulator [Oscillospiraceae bacterium 38-13]
MKIQELRENAGLSRVEVAARLGLDKSSISHWEHGKTTPTSDKLPLLADLFGCSIDALYGRQTTAPNRQDSA